MKKINIKEYKSLKEVPQEIMLKSYKVRLYPNKHQEDVINKNIGCSRFIYNQMLAEHIDVYKKLKDNKEKLKKYKYKTEKDYKIEFPFLKEVSSMALQQSRIDLQTSYKNFFKNNKGYPKFKSKNKVKWSYREQQISGFIEIKDNRIKLLKLGYVKIKGLNDRPYNQINNVTVTKSRSNKYYASILVETELIKRNKISNDIIGLDLGIKEFAIDSKGNLYSSISKELFKKEKELKLLQKHFARKKTQSNRKNKCRIKIARKHEQITNIRNYYQWHLANKSCSENQTIVIETLNIKDMMKNKNLSHNISYSGWGMFVTKLEQKAIEYDTKIIKANKYYPSSKTCSTCGNVKSNLYLKERIYICDKCGLEIDRDINASINLRNLSGELSDHSRGEIKPMKLYFDFKGNFKETITKIT